MPCAQRHEYNHGLSSLRRGIIVCGCGALSESSHFCMQSMYESWSSAVRASSSLVQMAGVSYSRKFLGCLTLCAHLWFVDAKLGIRLNNRLWALLVSQLIVVNGSRLRVTR